MEWKINKVQHAVICRFAIEKPILITQIVIMANMLLLNLRKRDITVFCEVIKAIMNLALFLDLMLKDQHMGPTVDLYCTCVVLSIII